MVEEEKKGPAPMRVPFTHKLYMAGQRHIGFKCSECGGTWLVGKPEDHRRECLVMKDSLKLDG